MNSRPTRPSLTELEGRAVPARLNVVFDFRFDDTEFFTDHPDRINVLNAAASNIADRFEVDLDAIPFPTPGNSWKAKFNRPSGVGQAEEVINLFVPDNSVVVFVGAREQLGNGLIEVSSNREVFGSAEWNEDVLGRGRPASFGPAATAFSPWGGSISFDQFNNWHFGLEPPGNPDEFDLYMAAQNGLMHLLGFGSSEAWARLSTSGSFTGPNASAVFGGSVPLTDGRFEWVEDTLSRGQRTPMDADFEDGERVVLTELDLAAMQDIGWARAGAPPSPAPPGSATEPPPTVPPVPVPAGLAMLAFGAGVGAGPNSAVTFNEATTLTRVIQFNPFGPSFTGGARVATGDVNGDGVEDVVAGPGPGRPTEVRVFSGTSVAPDPTGSLIRTILAFEGSFTGGVYVAVGDLNGDGAGDIAVSPDEGGGPRVRIFSGRDGGQLADYFGIDDPNFRGGARATFGDVNGDGTPDVVVAAGFGGGPRVTIWDGKSVLAGSPRQLANFFMFEDSLRNGVFIGAGDLNGDGSAEVIGGGGPGGGPRVLALNGRELVTSGNQVGLANFFAGDPNNRGGVPVGVDDPDQDGRVALVTGSGSGAPPVVTTYRGEDLIGDDSPDPIRQYRIFDPAFTGGVFVG